MKRPLCLFIEIHRGKLKTFAPSPRRMRRRHIAARPLESSTFTRQLGKKEKSKKKKKGCQGHPFASRCSPVWTEDGSGVKLAGGVILSGRHAEPLIIPELASFLFIKKC